MLCLPKEKESEQDRKIFSHTLFNYSVLTSNNKYNVPNEFILYCTTLKVLIGAGIQIRLGTSVIVWVGLRVC